MYRYYKYQDVVKLNKTNNNQEHYFIGLGQMQYSPTLFSPSSIFSFF